MIPRRRQVWEMKGSEMYDARSRRKSTAVQRYCCYLTDIDNQVECKKECDPQAKGKGATKYCSQHRVVGLRQEKELLEQSRGDRRVKVTESGDLICARKGCFNKLEQPIGKQKYCSKDCRSISNRPEIKKEKRQVECKNESCDNLFIAKTMRSVYCSSECRKKQVSLDNKRHIEQYWKDRKEKRQAKAEPVVITYTQDQVIEDLFS